MTSDKGRRLLARLFSSELEMWRGEAPLARVFWVYGVVLSSLLLGSYGAMIYFVRPRAEQFLTVFLSLYTLWILVAIWRCAANTNSIWGLLARMLAVAWAVNVAMILLFRGLDQLTRLPAF